jgi:hypothetical protein
LRAAWRRLTAALPGRAATRYVALGPAGVTVADAPAATARASCLPGAADAPAWQAPLALLAQWARGADWRHARVAVTLSNHFVRYALVPWRDDLDGAAERRAFVQHCFARVHGARAADWELRLSETRYGAPAVAAAVEPDLLAALHAVARDAGWQLLSVEPLLAAAFNQARAAIAAERYWFALAEPGRLCVARIEGGEWRRLRCQRLDADWQPDLARRLARERLLADGDEAPLYLYAPALSGGGLLDAGWTPTELQMAPLAGAVAAAPAALEGAA